MASENKMEDKAKKADSRRSFEIKRVEGSDTYYLGMPKAEDIRKAEWHYSKVYGSALTEGVATQSEMLDILRARGLYGPDYEAHGEEIRDKLVDKLSEMRITEDEMKRVLLAREVEELRNELFQWNQRLNGPLSNTCEQMAEDAKIEYLTSVMVEKESGSRVWKSFDEFLNTDDPALAAQARLQTYLLFQGMDLDSILNTPEKKVLQDFEEAKAEAHKEAAKALKEAAADSDDKTQKQAKRGRKKAAVQKES